MAGVQQSVFKYDKTRLIAGSRTADGMMSSPCCARALVDRRAMAALHKMGGPAEIHRKVLRSSSEWGAMSGCAFSDALQIRATLTPWGWPRLTAIGAPQD